MINKSNSNSLENETLTTDDISYIIKLSQDPDIYQRLIYSVAPNIPGNRQIKELILLMIISSVDKENSMELHTGAINILIISDSKFDKTELLNSINIISPNWNTNTNILNNDLNDDLICIEYSEYLDVNMLLLSDNDIIMICNPKNNKFDHYKSKFEQLDLSPQTVSYFDLIFLVEDMEIIERNNENDNELAIEILKHHGIYREDYIEYNLLKKYLTYAHENFHPSLNDEAIDYLRFIYQNPKIYNDDNRKDFLTKRDFEFIIRLAKAGATIKLKNTVDSKDIADALNLTYTGIKNYTFDPIKLNNNTETSTRRILQIMLEEIGTLENEFNEGAPLNVLYSNISEKYNIDEKIVYQLLQSLANHGLIYQNPEYYFHLAC